MKNLGLIEYDQKQTVTAEIEKLCTDVSEYNYYQLSLLLVATAQQGSKRDYNKVLAALEPMIEAKAEDSEKIWLIGRMLLAATIIDPQYTHQASSIPAGWIDRAEKAPDVMTAWGFGYLATLNSACYHHMRDAMMSVVRTVEKTAGSSDVLWAWIMSLQAAAFADEKQDYQSIVQAIKDFTKKASFTEIYPSLTRDDTSSDYPAWAIGIVCVAAAKMNDQALYVESKILLADAMRTAEEWRTKEHQSLSNQWKARAEVTMGHIHLALAAQEFDCSLEQDQSYSTRPSGPS